MHPRRGEVWWVRLDPAVGSEIRKTRPCIVMTNDVFNRRRKTVVVVPISSSPAVSPPLTIDVKGQRVSGVAAIEHVRSVSKERFESQFDVLNDDAMERVSEALKLLLDLE